MNGLCSIIVFLIAHGLLTCRSASYFPRCPRSEQRMSQNPCQAPNASSSLARRCFPSGCFRFAMLSSIVLVLLGLAVSVLSMLPSDASGFFMLMGLHLIACGMLAVPCAWGKRHGPVWRLLCWISILANAALAVRMGMLVCDGTIRGPLMIAAPLLVGVPAAINVVVAGTSLSRGDQANTQGIK